MRMIRRVGKANGSRERAPDGKLRVPTKTFLSTQKEGGHGASAPLPTLQVMNLQPSEQQQDQQDHDHEAQSAAAIVTGAVERSAADAAEAAK